MPGVGGITLNGGRERDIQVIVDPDKLGAVGLTARDVQRALAAENVEIPGGDVIEGERTLQLRVSGRISDPRDFGLIPLATRDGKVIRVADVA